MLLALVFDEDEDEDEELLLADVLVELLEELLLGAAKHV
jgi:hypothetical protein